VTITAKNLTETYLYHYSLNRSSLVYQLIDCCSVASDVIEVENFWISLFEIEKKELDFSQLIQSQPFYD